jgi:hypothetical protein
MWQPEQLAALESRVHTPLQLCRTNSAGREGYRLALCLRREAKPSTVELPTESVRGSRFPIQLILNFAKHSSAT